MQPKPHHQKYQARPHHNHHLDHRRSFPILPSWPQLDGHAFWAVPFWVGHVSLAFWIWAWFASFAPFLSVCGKNGITHDLVT
jgi:hypothetical protein